MSFSRRDALRISGSTLTGLSLGLRPRDLLALGQAAAPGQTPAAAEPWPDTLVERPLRSGFPAPLPLNADGSAPEHPASEAGPISDPLMWRTPDRKAPPIEYAVEKMRVKVDTRGLGKLAGTLRFADLEKLPRVSHTFLLQCGAANPRGIVTWTGVRFNDVANMLGVIPQAHYCRFIASDREYVDEDVSTLRHPQVMLAWMMNGAPLDPQHGAPLRLVVPFRYGKRSIKAITEIVFATPSLPMPPLPS
jgi:DMSO/TMAO reductase YedYZ molybdopterin-dependent catalytic subunit